MTDSSVSSPSIRSHDLQLKQCPRCGYSLEGLPAEHRCPECGYGYGGGTYMLTGRLYNTQTPLILSLFMFGFAIFQYWAGSLTGAAMLAFFGLVSFLVNLSMITRNRRLKNRQPRLFGNKWQLLLSPAGVAVSNGPADPDIIPWREFVKHRLGRHFDFKLTWTQPLKPKRRLILTGDEHSIWGPAPHRRGSRNTRMPERIDFVFDADADTAREIDRMVGQRIREAHNQTAENESGVTRPTDRSNQHARDA